MIGESLGEAAPMPTGGSLGTAMGTTDHGLRHGGVGEAAGPILGLRIAVPARSSGTGH